MKMDQNIVPTLLEFAIKNLLSDVSAALKALKVLPKQLFIPMFKAAYLGSKKEVLEAMVRDWPFHCLHIGTLTTQEPPYEILEAMVNCLQFVPTKITSSRGPKLRILDLRERLDYGITCSYRTNHTFCLHSCVYSQHSIIKVEEAQNKVRCSEMVTSESETVSAWKPIELVVNLFFNSNSKTKQFLSVLQKKIEQSFGSLHLCCRYLQVNQIFVHTSSLQILDPACINRLEVNRVHLRKVMMLLPQLNHVNSITLTSIPFQSCNETNFETFLIWLGNLQFLQELSLSFFYLSDQLHKLLRVLQSPIQLTSLSLPFCDLSNRDLIVLSQSSQVAHLKRLNLSNNLIFWGGHEPFQILLEKLSGTLQHLEINNCQVTDSALLAVIPALTRCSNLCVFIMAFNPLTMPMLQNLMQNITAMTNLKRVVYPVPVHCYEQGSYRGSLDVEKFAAVKAQLNLMLQLAQRNDMQWTTYSE